VLQAELQCFDWQIFELIDCQVAQEAAKGGQDQGRRRNPLVLERERASATQPLRAFKLHLARFRPNSVKQPPRTLEAC
jgi:hypothetical protein